MNKQGNRFSQWIKNHIRLVVILSSAIAFYFLVVSIGFFYFSITKPYMGADLELTQAGWRVASVADYSAAYNVGIKVGDTPVEINGQLAQVFLPNYKEAGTVLGILIKELKVVDSRGQVKSVKLSGTYPTRQSIMDAISWFIVSAAFWVVGYYVFQKRKESILAWLLLACGLAFGLALSANMAADRVIPFAVHIAVGATLFGPWLLFHFFLALPEESVKLRNSTSIYLIYFVPLLSLVFFYLVGYADGQPVQWFRYVRIFEYGIVALAITTVAILNYTRATFPRTKQQMKIILTGCLAALVPFILFSVLPTLIWEQTVVPSSLMLLFIIFIPLAMGYAVTTQKLMDIDFIIRRSVIYGLITIIMTVVLAAVITFMAAFQSLLGPPERILIALALGSMATLLFGPTKKGIETVVDKIFYKDRYDYRQIIQNLSTSLNLMKDSNEISRLVVGTTVQTLNLAGGALVVGKRADSSEIGAAQGIYTDTNKQEQLFTITATRTGETEFPNPASKLYPDMAYLIPLKTGGQEVGFLCLAHKVSRQDFSSDDLYLLQGIASVAAIGLHRAMLVQDVNLRDTFVSVASHELRTPLTSVVGYADLLMRRDPPEETRKKWTKIILDNGQRITKMVDELLNVSRINSGKFNIKLEQVKVAEVFEEALSLTRETTEKHQFVVDTDATLPDVLVDRDKFGQVILNILNNAVKYSPQGGQVTLAARGDREHKQVIVSIADQGIGISPADQEQLFTTFQRIQRPETQGIRGSGLGLYISKEWTEAMGGKIWVESDLSKGSTFFVAVPIWENSKVT